MILAYYITGIVVITLTSVVYNQGLLIWSDAAASLVLPTIGMEFASTASFEMMALLGVLIASFSMATVTLLISVVLSPVYAILLNIVLLVTSAFAGNAFLIFEYSIIARDGALDAAGHRFNDGLILAIIIMLATFILGMFFIRKNDIICWRKE